MSARLPRIERFRKIPLYLNTASQIAMDWEPAPGTREIRLHELDLYVTMACNIRCEFCNVCAGEYRHKDIPLHRIRSLLDEAVPLGLKECHLLGGEPLLRKDLEQIVEHAVSLGLHTRVITNGMLASRERLKSLIGAGLHEIMISVDGLEATHNRLRVAGPDGYRQTLTCVKDSIDLGLPTRVSMVAYRDNVDEVIPLMELAESLGADIFSCFLGSPLGRGRTMQDRVVDPVTWRRLQSRMRDHAKDFRSNYSVIIEQGFAWSDEAPIDRSSIKGRGTGCNTLLEDFDYLVVRSDGNLYQCVFFMTDGEPIGNILDEKLERSLQYALHERRYQAFTEPKDRCVTCTNQAECGTGCRGYAQLYKQDWLKTDPRCAKDAPDAKTPAYFPVCPIMKQNVRSREIGGSTEEALARGLNSAVRTAP